MSVPPEVVKVGRCFVMAKGQVRRVTEITPDGRVNYKARGKRSSAPWGRGPTKSALPSLENFAQAVDRWVRCDWDPDFPERPPE